MARPKPRPCLGKIADWGGPEIHRQMLGRAGLFLTDGRIELDNNPVERTIRPIALIRKNALFTGHDDGAQNWAVIASLIETCKLNAIEPHRYLSGVLTAIAGGHKQTDINKLLPWNYVKPV